MLSFLSKTGLNHFWLHIVARIDQANQQILNSLDKYYSPDNLPPYPVSSVNGLTGEVKINALPDYSTLNNDQFLRIIQGTPTWVTVPNAEGASF